MKSDLSLIASGWIVKVFEESKGIPIYDMEGLIDRVAQKVRDYREKNPRKRQLKRGVSEHDIVIQELNKFFGRKRILIQYIQGSLCWVHHEDVLKLVRSK